jgi:beta-fructofuranosidase
MFYGPSPIRLAVSSDLLIWELKGILFSEENGARDPGLIYYNNLYHMVYCTERKVAMRTSEDLFQWSEPTIIYESSDFDPESPSIIAKNGSFYLFVCSWDGIWDKESIQGAYQHKTYVFNSENIDTFQNLKPVTILNAHAPEIFQDKDQWFISSAEWPNRGINIDRLSWR